tara:strand:+ start:107782 stop:108999 length:1218 start_codon:yes stop_codon:yes gene_type:complete
MQRRSSFPLIIIVFSLFCTAGLQAEVKIELINGDAFTADYIQWGPSATLILETEKQGSLARQSFPLANIKRLFMGDSQYDQATIQLAAAQRGRVEPAHYISTQNGKPAVVTPLDYQTNTEPLPPFGLQPEIPCHSGCSPGIVLGVHDDPLSAYEPLVNQYFPAGVPTLERGHVLALMRNLTAQRAFGGSVPPAPYTLPLPPAPAPVSGKLAQIAVQATPLNTQEKADWNALAVRLQGFDRLGNPARISGSVRITLYGERQLLLRVWDQEFAAKPIKTISLAQWTGNCSANPEVQTPRVGNSFGAGQPDDQTWIVKLPSPLPEHNPNVYALGEIQVTLAAPGKGTFQASAPAVPLKHISVARDLSLANTGSRFLPSETTSAGISRMSRLNHNAPSRPNSRPLSVQP